MDLYSTLAEIAGAKMTPKMQKQTEGRSMVPLLTNPSAPWADRMLVHHGGRWKKGMREESKFVKSAIQNSRFTLINNAELYDLKADPGEKTNVISDHPEVVTKLRATYDQWWQDIQPLMVNENVTGPKINPFQELYFQQFGGSPSEADLKRMSRDVNSIGTRSRGGKKRGKKKKPNRKQESETEKVQKIEPNWESLTKNYRVPEWFVDGKIGVWFHWGVSSAADENRPNDGSHYGRRMYSPPPEDKAEKDLSMNEKLTRWHIKRYGPLEEFGYEDLIPLFKAEKWDPDALVKFAKDNGARFIMPVACHHDNFDMYDSFHPWNAVKMGPKRDTLAEWKAAAQKHELKFGVSTHLYWSPRFFANARKYQTPGTPECKLFNMDYSPRRYSTQDSWNEHWYARCWEIIDKYDPDMFNNDSPYPKIEGGKGLGVKLFTDFVNRDLKENNGKQSVVLSFKDPKVNRSAFTYNLERGGAGEIKPEPWMWACLLYTSPSPRD